MDGVASGTLEVKALETARKVVGRSETQGEDGIQQISAYSAAVLVPFPLTLPGPESAGMGLKVYLTCSAIWKTILVGM